MSKKAIGFYSSVSVIISNMIGVGVFTSLGYQVGGIKSGFAIMILWLIGGIAALLGALCYGELGSMFPRSGGEYNYLSKIFHPAVGFLSGWVSATVGFAAPVAASAMALGHYASKVFIGINAQWLAAVVVIFVAIIHSMKISVGRNFQNLFTGLNIFIIIGIIICGFMSGRTGDAHFGINNSALNAIIIPEFAISFFFVNLAYSGWNAAAYIAGEMDEPQKNLPKSLLWGTFFVMALYLLLNFIFLYTTPIAEMENKAEVGMISSVHIFGNTGANIMGVIISLLLLSSVSSMTLAGPRVISVMGEDFKIFKLFSRKNNFGVPAIAIISQCVISLLFIFTSHFDQVITYISFTLNLFLLLTVSGLMVYRIKSPEAIRPFKVPAYPVVPLVFIAISAWLAYYGFKEKPTESLAGMITVLIGLGFYYLDKLNSSWSSQRQKIK